MAKQVTGLFKRVQMNRKQRKEFGLTIPQLIRTSRQLKRDGLITGDAEDREDDVLIVVGSILRANESMLRAHADEIGADWDSFLAKLIQLIELLLPFFLMFI